MCANKPISGGFAMLGVYPDPADMVWYVEITIARDAAYGRATAKFVEDHRRFRVFKAFGQVHGFVCWRAQMYGALPRIAQCSFGGAKAVTFATIGFQEDAQQGYELPPLGHGQ